MPLIHLKFEERKKAYWELLEPGPVIYFHKDLYLVSPAHLKLLDEKGIKYTIKDPRKVRLPKPKLGRNSQRTKQ